MSKFLFLFFLVIMTTQTALAGDCGKAKKKPRRTKTDLSTNCGDVMRVYQPARQEGELTFTSFYLGRPSEEVLRAREAAEKERLERKRNHHRARQKRYRVRLKEKKLAVEQQNVSENDDELNEGEETVSKHQSQVRTFAIPAVPVNQTPQTTLYPQHEVFHQHGVYHPYERDGMNGYERPYGYRDLPIYDGYVQRERFCPNAEGYAGQNSYYRPVLPPFPMPVYGRGDYYPRALEQEFHRGRDEANYYYPSADAAPPCLCCELPPVMAEVVPEHELDQEDQPEKDGDSKCPREEDSNDRPY